MNFPFPELHMRDSEHVEWVKAQRDPEFWHAAAMAIVNTSGDPQGSLSCCSPAHCLGLPPGQSMEGLAANTATLLT